MKTFLIGLDGATYTVLDQMVERGLLPNMKRFYDEGARGILHSSPIPITPQAWTSMGTGRGAGHHGLHDFVRFDIGKNAFLRLNDSTDNHCEWMWKYLSRKGRSATVLNWYGIAPPIPIKGHTMPGFTSARHMRRASYPPDLVERLKANIENFDFKALGLSLEIERKGLTQLSEDEWIEWIDHHTHREDVWFSVLKYLAKEEPSDLTAVVFDGVDKLQHLAYHFIDQDLAPKNPNAWEQRVLDSCDEYFREIDDFLGQILEMAGGWSRVFIVSDHGFTAAYNTFYINKWLEDEGFLEWRSGTDTDMSGENYSESLGADANSVDIEKSVAFCLSPGSNGIYVRAPEGKYDEVREKIIERALLLKTPTGEPMITEVKKREDWLPGPFTDRIPDLLFTLSDHGFVAVLRGPEAVVRKPAAQGTHHPDGVILGIGPGIRPGVEIDPLEIVDVAPLVVHSIGEEIPAEYEGRFPSEMYDAGYLTSDPARIAKPVGEAASEEESEAQPADVSGKMDEEEEKMVLERLKSLGYLD